MSMPGLNESVLGGHCVRAVAFDNNKFGGSFVVANSWNTSWGDSGFFYMPYGYITNNNLCSDFWNIELVEG
jgi:C1A family cysteine protease